MPVTIEQWIKRTSAAAVAAGLGNWADSQATAFGKPIYEMIDGPVMLVLSELGFTYADPHTAFESRYDQVENLVLAPLRELMPRDGDLLPRNEASRLLTVAITISESEQTLEMRFSLRAYCQVASVLPRIVDELA